MYSIIMDLHLKITRKVRQMQIYMYICLMKMEKNLLKTRIFKNRHSLHIEINSIMKNFQGIVSTQLVPKGKMKRLSNKIRLPIATSYFRCIKEMKFFVILVMNFFQLNLNIIIKYWNDDYFIFFKNLNPGFVIMNSLFNPKIKKSDEVIIELKDINKKYYII